MKRLPRWAPYALLGPITGPLVRGFYRNLEQRRPVLAGLYALAILETWAALPLIFAHLVRSAGA